MPCQLFVLKTYSCTLFKQNSLHDVFITSLVIFYIAESVNRFFHKIIYTCVLCNFFIYLKILLYTDVSFFVGVISHISVTHPQLRFLKTSP